MKRLFLLVIDSFGIGALPDAAQYGDEGSNTAAGIGRALGKVEWPALRSMGLGNAAELTGSPIAGCPPEEHVSARYGVMAEKSPGKDTTTGHWEMAGIILEKAFPVFPPAYPSFPSALVDDFISQTGVPGILGNKAASGTVIIDELGAEHMETGKPICYTSADSVFQIASHVDVIPLKTLYEICEKARSLCNHYNVGRVIARPFEGSPGAFSRTADRHDWSIDLPDKTLLDYLRTGGVQTVAVGKIGSIFNEQGIDVSHHDSGNSACLERTFRVAGQTPEKDQFVFINLVDTDMIYGHRRDSEGYHRAVAEIDSALGKLESHLKPGDAIVVTGDHGCDPTFRGTDHTREYVPVLFRIIGDDGILSRRAGLGMRDTFADLSASVGDFFGVKTGKHGRSFL